MRKYIRAIRNNDFARNNLVFFVGSQLVAFLNYLYYPVLGRLLPIEAFGELQVLISLFTQMTIFLTVLGLVSTNIVLNEKDKDVVNRTVSELEKVTLYAALGVLAVVSVLSPVLQSSLKFESALPFVIIALVLVVGVPQSFRTAFLRGKGDFVAASVQGILASSLKIVASAGLVLLGFKAAGAAGGILLAQLLAFVYAAVMARRLGFVRHKSGGSPDWKLLRPQAGFAGMVLFVSLITTLFYSADVMIIKYLFSPEVAGRYAGISTIARIVLFLTASFAVVLLSSVKLDNPPAQNSRLLVRSFVVTTLLGGVVALVFAVFPLQVVHVLFGPKYDAFAQLLPLLSAAMLAVSLCNLLSNYHIALRHHAVMWYVGGGAVLTAVLLVLRHNTPGQVVLGLAIGSGSMLAGLFAWTCYRAGFLPFPNRK